MEQFSEAFGARVREILEHYGASPNSVELKSRKKISHMTVRRMAQGYPPSSDHIIEFAEAVGESADERASVAEDLLRLAGSRASYRLVPVRVTRGTARQRHAAAV